RDGRQDREQNKHRGVSHPAYPAYPAHPGLPTALAEDFRFETPYLRVFFPRVARQAGLLAGVREKGVGVPMPLLRNLRQQQPSMPAALDDQAMTADDDVLRSHDRLERAEQRDLDVDRLELVRRERRKPW